MKIVSAMLISRVVPGWPDQIIPDTMPLGYEFHVDLDSVRAVTLTNVDHPEWTPVAIETIEAERCLRLPLCCLRIEPDV